MNKADFFTDVLMAESNINNDRWKKNSAGYYYKFFIIS